MERKRVSFSVWCGPCQNLPFFTFWMNISIVYKKKGPFILRMAVALSGCSFRPAPQYFGMCHVIMRGRQPRPLESRLLLNTHLWTPDCPLAEVTLSPLPPVGHPSQPPVGTVLPHLHSQCSQTPPFLAALYPEPRLGHLVPGYLTLLQRAACVRKKMKMNCLKHPSPVKQNICQQLHIWEEFLQTYSCLPGASLKRL